MKLVNKSFKYRIYPSKEQQDILDFNIHSSRFVFNHIKVRYEMYKQHAKQFNKTIYANRTLFNQILNQLKDEHSFLKEANSTVLQKAYDDLIQAYKNIGRGNGWVKFKSKKDPVQTFRSLNVKVVNDKLKLPKMKKPIRMKYSRKIKGDILTGTITKENNKYFVSINVKNSPVEPKNKTNEKIGIDLGLKVLATFSNGIKIDKINFKDLDNKIKRQHQILSNKIKGSNNWVKAKTKLNKLYTKKKNIINDFLHKLTTKIVTNYDNIYVGNVSSQLGLKNKKLARTTADQHWFEFKRQLEYKSDWYDKHFSIVNEKYTSRTCSNCKYQYRDFSLNIREWICPNCNNSHDRDVNAAKNILTVGITGIAFGKTDNIVCGLGISD
jgi:putative transposase